MADVRFNSKVMASLSVAAAMIAAQAHATNFIVNGSFEDATNFVDNAPVGDNTMTVPYNSLAMTGWRAGGDIDLAWAGPGNPYYTASHGSYNLDLSGYTDSGFQFGEISQNITGLTIGTQYVIRFDLGSFGGEPISGVGVRSTTVNSGLSETLVYSEAHATPGLYWAPYQVTFTAQSTGFNLAIKGNQPPNSRPASFVGLDNVSLTEANAVPEPASWALMIGGFGLTGAALRRRRLATA